METSLLTYVQDVRLRNFSDSQLIVLKDGEIPYVRWVQIGSRPFDVLQGPPTHIDAYQTKIF